MLKKNVGLVVLLMALSGVVVAAGSAVLQARPTPHGLTLETGDTPDLLTLPLPLWDAIEQFSPFFVGTSLVSIGAVLRSRKKRDAGPKLP